ncbi:hypothetical protein [Streptomyces sp. ISL-100]|uniref:hypothetical protein n=1 Tax=Streptomyces sp. ISL-100 TaxID=2819173 RepID=UPI0027E4DDBB|nr:hypothetical protein [Streptomyces sp. ISL-100]
MPTHGRRWPLDRVDDGYTITDPESGQVRHFVDHPDGELALLAQIDDRNGRWITFEYDETGAPTSIVHHGGYHLKLTTNDGRVTALHLAGAAPDGTDQEILRYGYTDGKATTYEYDFTDQLAQATNDDATVILLRDRQSRLISESVNGRILRHSYDELGRRTSRTTPTGTESTWAYDVLGNPTALTTHGHILTFTHDTTGRKASRRLGEVTFTNAYDTVGRLTAQTVNGPADRLVQHRAYTYRPDGYVTRIDEHLGGTRHYGLDTTGRVPPPGRSPMPTTQPATRPTPAGPTPTQEPKHGDRARTRAPASPAPARSATNTTPPGVSPCARRPGTTINRAGQIRYEHDALGRIIFRRRVCLSREPDTWRYEWDACWDDPLQNRASVG